MKQIKYSILCEDDAQFTTIISIFNKLSAGKAEIIFSDAYYKQFKCRNKSDVVNKLMQASAYIVLPKYNLDLLLAGIDYDNNPREKFDEHLNNLHERVDNVAKHKTIIFFPVQAIEHWLWFIQYKIDHPTTTKNISDEVEKRDRKTTKNLVYKTVADKTDFINSLIDKADLDWLSYQSKSFKNFKQSIEEFISR